MKKVDLASPGWLATYVQLNFEQKPNVKIILIVYTTTTNSLTQPPQKSQKVCITDLGL